MKLTGFIVVIVAALLFLIPMMNNQQHSAFEREAQEEAPMEEMLEESNTFKIIYEVKRPEDESIADIIWMKEAAEVALKEGIPYFNVLEQKVRTRFNAESNQNLSVVEGIIELEADPMRAEFDAHEIQSLVLTDRP